MHFIGKKTEVDMTRGNILAQLFAFALPLLFGNLFQQLYNTVDTWVVGNYVGKVSFSAVGTLSSVTNTLIGFFSGFSAGASVVISQSFGAKDLKKVHDSVHTYIAVTLLLCFIFTLVGIALVPIVMNIMQSPEAVAEQQRIYLTIYFAGFAGLMIYNMGAAILRSVGNSTFPFILLVICATSNIFLDLLFVLVFNMGTSGVAWATIISQGISALVVVIKLRRIEGSVRLKYEDIRINWTICRKIFSLGIPAAVQLSIVAMSNVFVQRYINYFGTDVMGGWTSYTKIDQLFFLPMQSIALATTTFVGQNFGANNLQRMKKGTTDALFMAFGSTILLVTPVMFLVKPIISLFIDSSELDVIKWGSLFIRVNGPFFLVACINQVYSGALRGVGKSTMPMIAMISSFVVFRQLYLFVITKFFNTPLIVDSCYPLGWIVCSIIIILFYRTELKRLGILKNQ